MSNDSPPLKRFLTLWTIAGILLVIIAEALALSRYLLHAWKVPHGAWIAWGLAGMGLACILVDLVRWWRKPGASGRREPTRKRASEFYADELAIEIPKEGFTSNIPRQLPSFPRDFIGRGREIRQVTQNPRQGVVISGLLGMGGIGKTATGLVIAHLLKEQYPSGQIFLDLRGSYSQKPLTPAEAMAHVLHSFDQKATLPDPRAMAFQYRSVLESKKVLLFFDNASSADQVQPLLATPGSLTMVTSRHHFSLPGLGTLDLNTMDPGEARQLIVKIAGEMPAGQAAKLARLCGHLPRALHLAAGTLAIHSDWTPGMVIGRLQEDTELFEPMEACLHLSYQLLDKGLQLRFRQLGIFPASFDRQAAGAVWKTNPESTTQVLNLLLLSSLLEYDPGAGRYTLPDLLSEYALRRLQMDEKKTACVSYAKHYLRILRLAEELYKRGGEHISEGLALFDREELHIKTAQAWATSLDPALANAFPGTCAHLLTIRLTPQQRVNWLEDGLVAARRLQDKASEGSHLGNLGVAYAAMGETRMAIEMYQKRLEIARQTGNRAGEGNAYGNLGRAYASLGKTRQAVDAFEKALVIAREIGDHRSEGNALANMGDALFTLGEKEHGIDMVRQALGIYTAMQSPYVQWARRKLEDWGAKN